VAKVSWHSFERGGWGSVLPWCWFSNSTCTAYVVNGMNAQGYSSSGIRGGRQNGNRVLAEDLAFVGRVDWTPLPELDLGASVYAGNSGQDQRIELAAGGNVQLPDVPTVLWELHGDYESHGLHARALFTMTHLGDAGSLTRDLQGAASNALSSSAAVASEMLGGYGELAYDVLPLLFPDTERYLAPFYRFEWYDTQWDMPSGFGADGSKRIRSHTVGLQYEPIPNVVFKADYRYRTAEQGDPGKSAGLRRGVLAGLRSRRWASVGPRRPPAMPEPAEALAQAFGRGEDQPETFVLDEAQARRSRSSRAQARIKLAHLARTQAAAPRLRPIDVHNVRTLPEAFLVVLSREGSVRMVRVLAFHEPLEYMPSARWYQQFDQKTIADPLRLGGDVHAIVGATLSAQATTQGVRRALAIHQVLLRKEP
jgi:hypothetical protein